MVQPQARRKALWPLFPLYSCLAVSQCAIHDGLSLDADLPVNFGSRLKQLWWSGELRMTQTTQGPEPR